jgi:hypothetical protein
MSRAKFAQTRWFALAGVLDPERRAGAWLFASGRVVRMESAAAAPRLPGTASAHLFCRDNVHTCPVNLLRPAAVPRNRRALLDWRGLELTYGWASRYLTARTWNPSDAGGGLELVPTATTRAPWSATASRRCRYLKPEFRVNLSSLVGSCASRWQLAALSCRASGTAVQREPVFGSGRLAR